MNRVSAKSQVVPRSILITVFGSSEVLDLQKILLNSFKVRHYTSLKALVVKEIVVEYIDLFLQKTLIFLRHFHKVKTCSEIKNGKSILSFLNEY